MIGMIIAKIGLIPAPVQTRCRYEPERDATLAATISIEGRRDP